MNDTSKSGFECKYMNNQKNVLGICKELAIYGNNRCRLNGEICPASETFNRHIKELIDNLKRRTR